MALRAPPPNVWVPVERRLPGVYVYFLQAASAALQGVPGLVFTSWHRYPAENREVGGSAESQHLAGLGLDVVAPRAEVDGIVDRARRLGLVVVDEESHVHLQALPPGSLRRLGLL